jgi:hypothetical protein
LLGCWQFSDDLVIDMMSEELGDMDKQIYIERTAFYFPVEYAGFYVYLQNPKQLWLTVCSASQAALHDPDQPIRERARATQAFSQARQPYVRLMRQYSEEDHE